MVLGGPGTASSWTRLLHDERAVAAVALDFVEGGVGVAEQIVLQQGVVREDGAAERHRQRQGLLPADLDATLLDQGQDPIRDRFGPGGVAARQEDHELVAAVAPDHVPLTPAGILEGRADDAQDLVPNEVAIGIIEELEVVDIDQDDPERIALRRRAGQFGVERLLHRAVIGEAGQGIGVGQATHLLVELRVADGAPAKAPTASRSLISDEEKGMASAGRTRTSCPIARRRSGSRYASGGPCRCARAPGAYCIAGAAVDRAVALGEVQLAPGGVERVDALIEDHVGDLRDGELAGQGLAEFVEQVQFLVDVDDLPREAVDLLRRAPGIGEAGRHQARALLRQERRIDLADGVDAATVLSRTTTGMPTSPGLDPPGCRHSGHLGRDRSRRSRTASLASAT